MDRDSFEHGFLEVLFERAPVGLAVIDRDLRYVRVNALLAEINGVPAEEHAGRLVADVLPELAPRIERLLRGVLETREPILDLEISGATPADQGADRAFLLSFYPLLDADATIGVGGLVMEITEQVRAHRALTDQAAVIYKEIVQSLTVVQMALETGDAAKAREAVMPALEAAKQISSRILLESADG